MPRLVPTRLIDELPAVFRERDAERNNFLARFLQAFEGVFDGVRAEAALVPTLFAVDPTPSLRLHAHTGDHNLYLDSATGLFEGDVIRIESITDTGGSVPPRVEFGVLVGVRGRPQRPELPLPLPTVTPFTIELAGPLRFEHVQGAQVRRAGRPGVVAPLVEVLQPQPGTPPVQALRLADPEALPAAAGDTVQVGRTTFEYAQVVSTSGSTVVVTPPLQSIPPAETPVALLEPLATTTPPPALEYAERSGRELVSITPVFAGSARLELDTLTDLREGDLLEVRERDAQQSELVTLKDLPAKEQSGLGIPTKTIKVEPSLRFDHPAGTEVALLVPVGRAARLDADAGAGVRDLVLADASALGAGPGARLRIGSGSAAEHRYVESTLANGLRVRPPLARGHFAGEPVVRVASRSGGTGFLAWLASAVGLELRTDRGERWNRELVRLVGPLWRWRGTRRGVEELLAGSVRGEVGERLLLSGLERRGVEVVDMANSMQLGLVSTLGYDTVLCGRPSYFRADLQAERRSHRMHQPAGIDELVRAARQSLEREKPAHTFYDLHVYATTMQLGVDSVNEVGARLGDTTLLWDEPLVVAGDEERRP